MERTVVVAADRLALHARVVRGIPRAVPVLEEAVAVQVFSVAAVTVLVHPVPRGIVGADVDVGIPVVAVVAPGLLAGVEVSVRVHAVHAVTVSIDLLVVHGVEVTFEGALAAVARILVGVEVALPTRIEADRLRAGRVTGRAHVGGRRGLAVHTAAAAVSQQRVQAVEIREGIVRPPVAVLIEPVAELLLLQRGDAVPLGVARVGALVARLAGPAHAAAAVVSALAIQAGRELAGVLVAGLAAAAAAVGRAVAAVLAGPADAVVAALQPQAPAVVADVVGEAVAAGAAAAVVATLAPLAGGEGAGRVDTALPAGAGAVLVTRRAVLVVSTDPVATARLLVRHAGAVAAVLSCVAVSAGGAAAVVAAHALVAGRVFALAARAGLATGAAAVRRAGRAVLPLLAQRVAAVYVRDAGARVTALTHIAQPAGGAAAVVSARTPVAGREHAAAVQALLATGAAAVRGAGAAVLALIAALVPALGRLAAHADALLTDLASAAVATGAAAAVVAAARVDAARLTVRDAHRALAAPGVLVRGFARRLVREPLEAAQAIVRVAHDGLARAPDQVRAVLVRGAARVGGGHDADRRLAAADFFAPGAELTLGALVLLGADRVARLVEADAVPALAVPCAGAGGLLEIDLTRHEGGEQEDEAGP